MATPEGKFPSAYIDSVPAEGSDKLMVYTHLQHADIGARKSTLGTVDQGGPPSIEHVGKSAGRK